MQLVRCPDRLAHQRGVGPSIFLAGGITGCPNWQESIERLLRDSTGVLLNPRREEFPADASFVLEQEQVGWEHEHLLLANAHAFFFPPDTFCPVTLFELGKILALQRPLFVATHPDYKKRDNVHIQLSIVRPDVEIVHGIAELADQITGWITSINAVPKCKHCDDTGKVGFGDGVSGFELIECRHCGTKQ